MPLIGILLRMHDEVGCIKLPCFLCHHGKVVYDNFYIQLQRLSQTLTTKTAASPTSPLRAWKLNADSRHRLIEVLGQTLKWTSYVRALFGDLDF